MENQHRKIAGYRDLTVTEIFLMNSIKAEGERLRLLMNELRAMPEVDQQWVNIATTQLQQGIMAAVRSVAQPTSF